MTSRLQVLFDDSHHCVVLKRAGMPTHGRGKNCLRQAVRREGIAENAAFLEPVHRLDHGTQGPVMLAKSPEVQQLLQSHWGSTTKIYHAWVAGDLRTSRGTIGLQLNGKASVTKFKLLGKRPWAVHESASLVELELLTGRTHQLRRHLANVGHPIVGDSVYGSSPVFTGHGIHLSCTSLAWFHPITGDRLRVEAIPQKKMRRAVRGTFIVAEDSPLLPLFEPT